MSKYPKTDSQHEAARLRKFPPLSEEHERILLDTGDDQWGSIFSNRPRSWLRSYKRALRAGRPSDIVVVDCERHSLRAEIGQLKAVNEAARERIVNLEGAINAMSAVAMSARGKLDKPRKRKRDGQILKEAVAVIVIGDWHVAKTVDSKKTGGFNAFNPEICEARVNRLADSAVKMCIHVAGTVPLTGVRIMSVGDLLENELRNESIACNSMGPIDELVRTTQLVEGLVDRVQSQVCAKVPSVKRVDVGFVWGNHARITPKIEWGRIRETSYEYKVAVDIGRRFADHDHVSVDWAEGDQLMTDVLGTMIRWHHGMAFRYQGGIGGITPSAYNKIRRMNSGMDRAPSLDVVGHWHHHTAPHGLYLNNCLCGYDSFAQGMGFERQPPSQGFFLIDSTRGLTLQTQLFLED